MINPVFLLIITTISSFTSLILALHGVYRVMKLQREIEKNNSKESYIHRINFINKLFINKKLEKSLNLELKSLTVYQKEILEKLSCFKCETIEDISVFTRIKPAIVKSVFDELKENHLVYFCDDQEKSVKLTAYGYRIKDKIISYQKVF